MNAIESVEQAHRKPKVAQVQSGDTVRVHQKIREGNKQRVQVFEGVVIRTHRQQELNSVITVRRIASNVGVEKTFLVHSPNVEKIEIVRRSKVRRNFLSYLRGRRGKSARLQELGFDKAAANVAEAKPEPAPKAETADEAVDTEITEVVDEDVKEDVSTEDLAKEEDKAAAADDIARSDDPGENGDEAAAPAEEVEIGLDKAAKETDQ